MVFTPEFETETASDLAGLVLEIHHHLARDLVLSWRYGLWHVLQPLSLADLRNGTHMALKGVGTSSQDSLRVSTNKW
jgi:hypothetical protein